MKLNVHGYHLEVTQAIEDYSEKKFLALEKYFEEGITGLEAELEHRNNRAKDKQNVAQLTMKVHGGVLRAEVKHADMYAAIDLVVEKLEKQLKKFKDKLKNHRKEKVIVGKTLMDQLVELPPEDEPHFPRIVKTKKFAVKPMSVEEAAMQLNLIGHDFYVFKNSDTNETNVVYVRSDASLGLIEPEF
jgi:putative sigma-54 modulation protein